MLNDANFLSTRNINYLLMTFVANSFSKVLEEIVFADKQTKKRSLRAVFFTLSHRHNSYEARNAKTFSAFVLC